jgi:hypothetical protein
MNRINRELILDSLKQLSDRPMQESLWMGKIPSQQSSFEEAVECLFTDTGLSDALTRGASGFSSEIERKLLELERWLMKVEARRGPMKVINDPAMIRVRELASEILHLLNRETK